MLNLLASAFEIKSVDDATGHIEGYGAFFGNVDKGKDICVKGCFADTIREHKAAGTLPHMYWNHDGNEPAGCWADMGEEQKGLFMIGDIAIGRGIPGAEKSYLVAKSKTKRGMSIGYMTRKSEHKSGIRHLLSLGLEEVSIVPNPMNSLASFTNVKSEALFGSESPLTAREAEGLLRDVCGFSTREAKCFLARVYDGIKNRDDSNSVIAHLKSLADRIKNT